MSQSGDLPQAQGLYDPQHEHDACGVGFVVHINGERSHAIVEQGCEVLMQPRAPRGLRLRGQHRRRRGASSCRCPTGSSARHGPAGVHAARARRVRRRPGVPAARAGRARRRASRRCSSAWPREEGQPCSAGVDVPTDDRLLGRPRRATEPRHSSRSSSRRAPVADRPIARRFERKLYVIRKRVEHEADALGARRARTCSTSPACRRRRSSTRGC